VIVADVEGLMKVADQQFERVAWAIAGFGDGATGPILSWPCTVLKLRSA
jgi:hypothetical protein